MKNFVSKVTKKSYRTEEFYIFVNEKEEICKKK